MGITFNPLAFSGFSASGSSSNPNFTAPVAAEVDLPVSALDGQLCVVQATDRVYVYSNSYGKWVDTGITSIAFGTSGSSEGLVLSLDASGTIVRTTLQLTPADGTNPGAVSTTTQTFAGDKTFLGVISASNFSSSNVPSTVVTRDSSGNFSANTITASLVGHASLDEPAITAGTSSQYWRGDKTFQTLDTSAVPENTNLYYTDARADARITLQKGANNGLATLDSGGKIPSAQLPSTVMDYLGTWNASTNTPTLADGVGNAGDIYVTSVAGTQNLGSGSIAFAAGDWVVYNGTIWEKSINSNAVVSVNGQQGVVSLNTDNISEGTSNLYFTTNRARTAAVENTINSAHTDIAPSGFAVDAALATKQATGNYITALTGDVTATGPGSSTATLASVGTPGTYTKVTTDSKGRITSGTTLSGTDIPAIDLTVSGPGGTTGTLPNSKTSAVSINTFNTLVLRDSAGNFSAGTITASLQGNVDATSVGVPVIIGQSRANNVFIGKSTGNVNLSGSTIVAADKSISLSTSSGYSNAVSGSQVLLTDPSANTGKLDSSQLLIQDSAGTTFVNATGGQIELKTSGSASLPSQPYHVTTKSYVDSIATPTPTGDILPTSFTAADNQSSASDITGFVFANASVRGFRASVTVTRGSTYAIYTLNGIQKASSWELSQDYLGDATGITFSITSAGQIQYTTTSTGNTADVKFRAEALPV